jgi:hypothetical protein
MNVKHTEGSSLTLVKVLSRNLPGGTEENHKDLSQDSRSLGQDLKAGASEYEALAREV